MMAVICGFASPLFVMYKMIKFDALHCATCKMAFRVANRHFDFMGRRSQASTTPPGYLLAAEEKQSTFTGAQQRRGVYIIPHAVSGVFGIGEDRPVPLDPAVLRKRRDEVRSGGPRGGGGGDGDGSAAATNPSADSLFHQADDGEEEELPTGFTFDWDAYRDVFGDMPLEDLVTAMLAEYATPYARIAGWATFTAAELMTLDVAEALSNDAAEFFVGFVKPC
eukprot:TRINITY_DN16405_c0_g1_i1.p1 TRINITY_DN16405_c0_g1~~TRINITY_DN16405_c0_g1_i1.p1  ORF type:complete len:222 (+),score=41.96 TRINITY_DN16405_c0_g1_i1:319-984(+)